MAANHVNKFNSANDSYYIYNYFETTNITKTMSKQTVSDSCLGLYD